MAESWQQPYPAVARYRQKLAVASSLRSSDSPVVLLLRFVIRNIHESGRRAQAYMQNAKAIQALLSKKR
jgi:hypothetical protein